MPDESRRVHLAQLSALIGSLLFGTRAQAQDRAQPGDADRPDALSRAQDLSFALARHRIQPRAWQEAIAEALVASTPESLFEYLEVDAVSRTAPNVQRGASVVRLRDAFDAHLPRRRRASVKLFFLERGRANPPHAHDHIVSAHMVLSGRFRFRHFERVRDEHVRGRRRAIVVRPSIDRELGPGELTSVSDFRGNIHWHEALTDGVLLDVIVSRLHRTEPSDRHMLDIRAAETLDGGLLRARIINHRRALAEYG